MKQLIQALCKAKREFGALHRDSKGNTGTRDYDYMSLDEITAKISGPLNEAAIHLYHTPDTDIAGGKVTVTCHVTDGEFWLHPEPSVTFKIPEAKNPAHVIGSLVTYGRRYTTLCALGLAPQGEDTDAQELSAHKLSDDEQEPPKAQPSKAIKPKRDSDSAHILSGADPVKRGMHDWLHTMFERFNLTQGDRLRILNQAEGKDTTELAREIKALSAINVE